jgi:hypothetical protein
MNRRDLIRSVPAGALAVGVAALSGRKVEAEPRVIAASGTVVGTVAVKNMFMPLVPTSLYQPQSGDTIIMHVPSDMTKLEFAHFSDYVREHKEEWWGHDVRVLLLDKRVDVSVMRNGDG